MNDQAPQLQSSSVKAAIVRLYWMLGCNAMLAFALLFKFENYGRFKLFDPCVLILEASLISARYVDIRFLAGTTGDGRPATMADFKKFALIHAGIVLAAWLAVHASAKLL